MKEKKLRERNNQTCGFIQLFYPVDYISCVSLSAYMYLQVGERVPRGNLENSR